MIYWVSLIIMAIIFAPALALVLWISAVYVYFIWKDWPSMWKHFKFWEW